MAVDHRPGDGRSQLFLPVHARGSGLRSMRPVPGSTVFRDQEGGDGWEQDTEELRFVGYLVTLDIF